MKSIYLSVVVVFIFSTSIFAGGFGYGQRDVISDPIQNKFYIGINKTSKGMFSKSEKVDFEIANYLIYDPTSGKKKLIFPEDFDSPITFIVFEFGYDSIKHRMNLSTDIGYERNYGYTVDNTINNFGISNRAAVDKILFIVNPNGGAPGLREIWTSKKDGSDLKKIDSIKIEDNWHIDLLNQKIRIIIQKGKNTEIKEHTW